MGVVDEQDRQRFVHAEDGHEAELVYEAAGGRLILLHTEVPEALGGRGIGGQLVRAAVERAAGSGETLLPLCSYARAWLQDHADEATAITIDWSEER